MSKIHIPEHSEHCGCSDKHISCGCGCHEHKDEHMECGCHKHNHTDDICCCQAHNEEGSKTTLTRIIASAGLLILAHIVPVGDMVKFLIYMISYLLIGYDILKQAIGGIAHKNPFDENFLMAVATIGAIILGEFTEAVMVMLFYRVGMMFEGYAVGKSRRNIAKLMDIRPDYANIEKDGKIVKVRCEDVEIGSIIVVKPGEKVAIDGVIIDGASSVDLSSLTGESVPSDVEAGDEILGGAVNLTGPIKVKTTKEFSDSTVSKILEIVENASSKKAKSEHFIKKFALYYTPIVCLGALALAVLPPIVRMLLGMSADFSEWIYRALTFLVISCPCALVISIPLSFFAGIGGASRAGILIKGSNFVETLSKLKCVIFDKTGTLTKGEFKVKGVYFNKMSADKVLYYAALAESYCDHPISQSLKNVFTGELDKGKVSNIKEIAGHGVMCKIGESEVAVGNEKLMKKLGVDVAVSNKSGTSVHIAVDGKYEGYILICDTVKDGAKESVLHLKKMGIKHTVMLTGDNASTAKSVAEEIGIDEYYSSLLPSDKVKRLEKYLEGMKKGERLAFVGDGINDAPVISRADVGIAMGLKGLDAAIEAADVVLMDDNVEKISTAVGISKKCMKIVYENIYFSIGVKALCLVLGALGVANMWFAIFADVGVMVLAVLNAIRCLKWRG